jgi:hypothetical protein
MRYGLRTLVILTAIGPPLLAAAWWTAIWLGANPLAFAVMTALAYLATWIVGPIAWYRELMKMVCGPEAFGPLPRKTRRRVRFRIERYAGEST